MHRTPRPDAAPLPDGPNGDSAPNVYVFEDEPVGAAAEGARTGARGNSTHNSTKVELPQTVTVGIVVKELAAYQRDSPTATSLATLEALEKIDPMPPAWIHAHAQRAGKDHMPTGLVTIQVTVNRADEFCIQS